MQKLPRLLLFLAGVILAGCLIVPHARAVGTALRQVGPTGFLLYIAGSAWMHLLSTWAWRVVVPLAQTAPSIGRLLSFRLAGEAVNKVTPLASLGGEPLKAYLLSRAGVPLRDSIVSVAISKNIMVLAQLSFMFMGIALACLQHPERSGVFVALGAFPLFVLSGIVFTVALDARLRRHGKSGETEEASQSPASVKGWAKARTGIRAMMDVWGQVVNFFWDHPRTFLISLLFFFVAGLGGALETWISCRLLGFPLTPLQALTFECLLMAVNFSTFFIPANAGSQEGGFALLTPVLGLAVPQAAALAMLRRCRDLLWISLGLLYLMLREGRGIFSPMQPEEPAAS